MRYRALLIDADDTIFDFQAAERAAINAVLVLAGIRDPGAGARYARINRGYWEKLERGEVTASELRVARFRDFAREYDVSIAPETLADVFVDALSNERALIPGAQETVAAIAVHMPVAIVTNGIAQVQHARFDASSIMRHIAAFVISGEVGFQKPDPRIIDLALSRLGASASDALFAGDSLASDMLAAARAGVDACWYNPRGIPRPDGARIQYEIKDIRELKDIALAP
ncbi:MAG: YjjG family noncanonical pyrimidine nucleotidase [Christensenellales bacterium]|jgi:2-haloacid dehalogenase